tara:strand:- start:25 stop:342 length:318 start_codon:yes stop_codon:yes gene_type:complete
MVYEPLPQALFTWMNAMESPEKPVPFVETVSRPEVVLLELESMRDSEELYIERSKFAPFGLVRPREKPLFLGTSIANISPWSAGLWPALSSPKYVALLSDRFTRG